MEVLEIGTAVRVNKQYGMFSIETIVRDTKTLWITNKETRIRKDNGFVFGTYRSVKLATPEDYEEIEKHNLSNSLRQFNFSKLDLETLRKIHALTKEA